MFNHLDKPKQINRLIDLISALKFHFLNKDCQIFKKGIYIRISEHVYNQKRLPVSSSQKQTASLKSVARLAGVSIATVSRVLNGDPVVKPETKLAVEKAIKASGYHPNRVAQRLRSSYKSGKLI